METENEDEIHRRLADDPWVSEERIVTVSVEPWHVLVGVERLAV